jgi:hypothetical protein
MQSRRHKSASQFTTAMVELLYVDGIAILPPSSAAKVSYELMDYYGRTIKINLIEHLATSRRQC